MSEANPGAAAKSEAAELLAAVGAIRRVARRAVGNTAHAKALPPARSELLRLTARRPGLSVVEAAHELRLAPNSVSTMVSQLVADGLISRGRGDGDGRMVRLAVTDAGAARIAQWRDLRAEMTGRALERLPEADRQTIRLALPALDRLAEQMEELLGKCGGAAAQPPQTGALRGEQSTCGRGHRVAQHRRTPSPYKLAYTQTSRDHQDTPTTLWRSKVIPGQKGSVVLITQ